MSDDGSSVRLTKWPFYFADLMLSAVAVYVLYRLGTIAGPWEMAAAAGCLVAAGWGAWFSIKPWLIEHDARLKLTESSTLKSSLEQIKELDSVAALIRNANSQWQGVQDASGRTVAAAQEIAERMKAETADFMKFIQKAHDQERANLRLEVDKLRRMEGDWLKTVVQILDHIYALNQAAIRSGQDPLIAQLAQFQNACRDVARRMGLAPYIPTKLEPFNAQGHQLPNPEEAVPEGARVGEVLATGFTYQGQLLRRALVLLAEADGNDALQNITSGNEPAVEASDAGESVHEQAAEIIEPEERIEQSFEEPGGEEFITPESTEEIIAESAPAPADHSEIEPAEQNVPEVPMFKEENFSEDETLAETEEESSRKNAARKDREDDSSQPQLPLV
jgi:molecular chaperone GrpE (heat shock protein)